MPYCPNCGQENNPSSRFCLACGTKLESVVEGTKGLPVKAIVIGATALLIVIVAIVLLTSPKGNDIYGSYRSLVFPSSHLELKRDHTFIMNLYVLGVKINGTWEIIEDDQINFEVSPSDELLLPFAIGAPAIIKDDQIMGLGGIWKRR